MPEKDMIESMEQACIYDFLNEGKNQRTMFPLLESTIARDHPRNVHKFPAHILYCLLKHIWTFVANTCILRTKSGVTNLPIMTFQKHIQIQQTNNASCSLLLHMHEPRAKKSLKNNELL